MDFSAHDLQPGGAGPFDVAQGRLSRPALNEQEICRLQASEVRCTGADKKYLSG
jgi:hypothetical protein